MIAHSRILAKRIDEIPAAINDMYEYRHWKNNCVLLNMTKEGACSLIAMVNRQYKNQDPGKQVSFTRNLAMASI